MRRIAIINQKGGVGKTTTTVNVGAALARAGHRVLLIDLDPQAHLTLHLGVDPASGQPGVYELLTGSETIAKARKRVAGNLWVVGSSIDLAAAEVELVSVVGREVILRDLIDQHAGGNGEAEKYDYVLMDCPPSLGVLTLNGLCAANEVIIPLQPHYLALQGLGKLLETVSLISRRINPLIKVAGVVICMKDIGTRLSAEVIEDVERFLAQAKGTNVPWGAARVYTTSVRRNIKLAESPSYGKSIFDYAAESNGAGDYAALAAEIHSGSAPVAAPVPAPAKAELTAAAPALATPQSAAPAQAPAKNEEPKASPAPEPAKPTAQPAKLVTRAEKPVAPPAKSAPKPAKATPQAQPKATTASPKPAPAKPIAPRKPPKPVVESPAPAAASEPAPAVEIPADPASASQEAEPAPAPSEPAPSVSDEQAAA